MKKLIALGLIAAVLSGCGKIGINGAFNQMAGNWAQVMLPEGCKVRFIAASNDTTAILCEDGRVFH